MRTLAALAALTVLTSIVGCDKTKPVVADAPVTSAATSASSAPGTDAPKTMTSVDKAQSLASASNALALDLWARTKKDSKDNFVFSPASISMAFAMTYAGAKGETAAQMKKVLHFDDDPSAWGAFGRTLSDPSRPLKLEVANRLFGEKTYAFVPAFVETTRTAFGAPLEMVDFKGAPDPARQRINGWVEEQTEKRIKDLLPAQSIKPLTRMVLVNAIYFLAEWGEPFEKTSTIDLPFQTGQGISKKVPTMRQTSHFRLAQVSGAKVLEMPYKGGTASCFFVLPDKVDGLSALESSLSSATLEGWMKGGQYQNVAVSLPRFEINPKDSLSLSTELIALGMPNAFDREKADFTGMGKPSDPRELLHIDEAFHKAFVKVDENGTEAAAATAVVMAAGGGPPRQPVELKFDHPFLFFVVDKASGLVLFMGRTTEP